MDCLCNLKRHIYGLNLFESAVSHTDEFESSTGRLSTRIYLVAFVVSVTVFIFYVSMSTEIKIVITENPSQSLYEQLQEKYSSSLECPCSTIAIPYRQFIHMSTIYHEVCSSVFVSDEWLTSLHSSHRSRYYQRDFRATGTSIFQLLRTLCEWHTHSYQLALDQFGNILLISPLVLSPTLFNIQSEEIFSLSNRILYTVHDLILYTICIIMEANQLIPAVQTIGVFQLDTNESIRMVGGIWKGFCWCFENGVCDDSMGLYDDLFGFQSYGIYDHDVPPYANISGFRTGCYALGALMRSSLECLYNQTCIDLLESSNDSHYEPLNEDNNTFSFSSPSDMIVLKDFFVQYRQNTSQYSEYYTMCAPINCRYSFEQRVHFLYVLTNLLGVCGGLEMLFRLIIPVVVKKIRIWWVQRGTQSTTTEQVIPIRTRLIRLWLFIRTTLIELNLFGDVIPSLDPYEIQSERLATRVYILIFTLTILLLLIVNLIMVRFRIANVENPSEATFEKLHSIYGTSIQCPCSTIAIPYDGFSSNLVYVHPVCRFTDFTSPEWYSDFPIAIQSHFKILNSLCLQSRNTIQISMVGFSSQLITKQVLPRELLTAQVLILRRQLEKQAETEFVTSLHLNRAITHADKLMTIYHTNIYYQSQEIKTFLNTYNNGKCDCALTSTCIGEIAPSFYLGCYAMEAFLQSSLECFYDADCVSHFELFRILDNNRSVHSATILNAHETQFALNTTLETIVNNLMIEKWNTFINYTRYYNICAPTICTYSYQERYNVLVVLTILLSLFSGLNVALKILVPFCLKTIRNYIVGRRRLHFDFKAKLTSWNMFPTYTSQRGDIFELHTERIATRIYAASFIVCFLVVTIYTAAKVQIKDKIIDNPTQIIYEQLQEKYGTTLKCPCKTISINYGSFVPIKPVFHQVCSSSFISTSWLSFLFNVPLSNINQLFVLSQFQFLSSICQISEAFSLNVALTFNNDSFISPQVIAQSSLRSEISSLMSRFLVTTPETINKTVKFTQGLIHGNAIISALHTNWKLVLSNDDNTSIYADPVSYGNCSCGIYLSCTQETIIPGLRIGCYPVSAFLQSTLECFYNQTCISTFFGWNNWTVLDANNTSRFSPFDTVKSIVDQLMIEEWKNDTNYTLYYEKCAPTSCSYSYSERLSAVYMITTLSGLYGGLTMILRFIIFYLVKFGRSCYQRRNTAVAEPAPLN